MKNRKQRRAAAAVARGGDVAELHVERARVYELEAAELRVKVLSAELELAVRHAECDAASDRAGTLTRELAEARRRERETRKALEVELTEDGRYELVGSLDADTCIVQRKKKS